MECVSHLKVSISWCPCHPDLQHVITSDAHPLVPFLFDGIANPTNSHWLRTEKLVLTWIKSTVSPFIAHNLLLSCTTVAEAWTLLDWWLNPLSGIHLWSICDRLYDLQKDYWPNDDWLSYWCQICFWLSYCTWLPSLRIWLGEIYCIWFTSRIHHLSPSLDFYYFWWVVWSLGLRRTFSTKKNSGLSTQAMAMAATHTSSQLSKSFRTSSNRRNSHSHNRGNRECGRGV